jgi:hypothetical protein
MPLCDLHVCPWLKIGTRKCTSGFRYFGVIGRQQCPGSPRFANGGAPTANRGRRPRGNRAQTTRVARQWLPGEQGGEERHYGRAAGAALRGISAVDRSERSATAMRGETNMGAPSPGAPIMRSVRHARQRHDVPGGRRRGAPSPAPARGLSLMTLLLGEVTQDALVGGDQPRLVLLLPLELSKLGMRALIAERP